MTQDPAVPRRPGPTGDHGSTRDPETGDVGRDQASRVAGTASSEASRLGGRASDGMKSVAGETRAQVRGIADTAIAQVRERADEQVDQAGQGLRRSSEQLQALARGNPDEAGAMGDYAESAAEVVAGWADRLDDRGIDGLLGDMSDFARRKPGQFLVGALFAGVVAGRVGRSVRAADVHLPERPEQGAPDATPGAGASRGPLREPVVASSGTPPTSRHTDGERRAGGSREPDWIDGLDGDPSRSTKESGSQQRRGEAIEGRP
ncbi:hypothetical protein [Salsipaludibacter albus]|uniref:hypothetical protein n=1 Tax=Salsipaludibacter albus TaxID=2849650 RepID=UPI001EE476F3|nr:hypothetical protein [Salsipaludibacter albus]MBY5161359.1 hypothetical protein [Salsipaludibacter albus]